MHDPATKALLDVLAASGVTLTHERTRDGEQHLHRYCDEFAFRGNHRKATDGERTEAALKLAPGARVLYKTNSD